MERYRLSARATYNFNKYESGVRHVTATITKLGFKVIRRNRSTAGFTRPTVPTTSISPIDRDVGLQYQHPGTGRSLRLDGQRKLELGPWAAFERPEIRRGETHHHFVWPQFDAFGPDGVAGRNAATGINDDNCRISEGEAVWTVCRQDSGHGTNRLRQSARRPSERFELFNFALPPGVRAPRRSKMSTRPMRWAKDDG